MELDWAAFYEHLHKIKIDNQKIQSEKIKNYRFSEKLFRQCQQSRNRSLSEALSSSTSQKQAIQSILPIFYDAICLKENIYKMFADLQIEKKIKHHYQSFMKNMTINDFISILLRCLQDRNQVGQMLLGMRIPILIYAEIGEKSFFYPEAVEDLMVNEDCGVILDMGTKKSRQKGKSEFIFKLFNLNKNYRYKLKSKAKLYKNSFFVHSFCLEETKRKILGDFNGSISQIPKDLSLFIQQCQFLIFHAIEDEITNQRQLNGIKQFLDKNFSSTCKILFVISGCQQEKQEIYQLLPESIQEKMILFCYDQEIEETMLIQVADQLISKGAFKSSPKELNSKQLAKLRKQNFDQEIKQIIDSLPKQKAADSKKSFFEIYFPFTFYQNLIIQQKEKGKRSKNAMSDVQNRYSLIEEIEEIQGNIEKIKQQMQSSKLSDFSTLCYRLLQKYQYKSMNQFQKHILGWKKKLIGPIQKQYVQLTKKLITYEAKQIKNSPESLKIVQQIRKIEKQIDEYDISLTTVSNELVLYILNLEQKKQPFQKFQKVIQKTYFESIRMNIPINFVDSKNLTFSNRIQASLMKKISGYKRTENKKIYIVSIIGAQSSAKSTLLNYLFRCNFETSAGRCTKGMYFNICELGDKVIFIIDTQGLLSINGRDAQFDNRIATFILTISNLVIINNKGEINSNLKNLLQICMFVIKCIKKDIQQKKQPQNIIFALRDQLMEKEGQNIQEAMLAKVHAQLYESSKRLGINYLDYFNIKSEDLFCFPSSISSQQLNKNISSFGITNYYNQMFGKCVRGLRSRILQILDSPGVKPFESMQSCAKLGATCWNSILACGPQLLNYKTYLQLETKQELQKIVNNKLHLMTNKLRQKYKELFKEHQEEKSGDIEKKRVQIENIINAEKQKTCNEYVSLYEEEGRKICMNEEWLKQKSQRIRKEGRNIQILQRRKLRQEINKKQSLQKMVDLENLIQQEIQNILVCQNYHKLLNFPDLQSKIREKKAEIIEKIQKNELKKSELDQLGINVFTLIQDTFYENQVGKNWSDWSEAEARKNINCYFQQEEEKTKVGFCHSEKSIKYWASQQQVKKKIIQTIKANIEHRVQNSKVIKNEFKNIFQSEQIREELSSIAKDAYGYGQEYFNGLKKKKAWSFKLRPYNHTQIQFLLKSVLSKRLTNHLGDLRIEYVSDMKIKLDKGVEQRIANMKELFNIKEKLQKVSKLIFSNICEQQWRKLSQKIDKTLEETYKRFLKQKRDAITKEAYEKSINSKQFSYLKWIQCFKMIMNPLLYRKEILFHSQYLKQFKKEIEKKIEEIVKQFQLVNIRKLVSNIEWVEKLEKKENVNSQIKRLFSSYKIINISNFQNQQIIRSIAKAFLDKKQYSIIWLYQNRRQRGQLAIREQIINYFVQQLVKKVTKQIGGCEHQCPFCSAKCTLQRRHQGGHFVESKNHYIMAFGGHYQTDTYFPIYSLCISRKFEKQLVQKDGEEMRKLEYLVRYEPRWHQSFKKAVTKKDWQKERAQRQLCEIWANIENLLISHRYHQIKSDNRQESKRNNALSNKDLQKIQFEVSEGKFKLSKYLKSN